MTALADRYDAILLDLDGVLYRGDQAVEGAASTVAELRDRGRRLAFLTNNSSRTPEQIVGKLAGLGITASPAEVVTSALATADLLVARGGGSAFAIGEDGLRRALAEAGIRVLSEDAERVDWVVVGLDRGATYRSLTRACMLVQRGAKLVATNGDVSFPVPEGVWPGAGALLAVVTSTTGATPEVVGKPRSPLFRSALDRAGGGRPLVVGDRIDTDIVGAVELGWDSVLVLTGVSSESDLSADGAKPTYIGNDVGVLLDDPAPR